VATQNSQKKSPRSSAKSERSRTAHPPMQDAATDFEQEEYMDRSNDHVARVRAARETAQREMESFGDVSEYDVTVLQGQLKEPPVAVSQPALDFDTAGQEAD
jgi:hypothetical protein